MIAIDGRDTRAIPELLVHDDDMTRRLKIHGERIHLRLIGKEQSENSMYGKCWKPDHKPRRKTIAIHLKHFPERSQQLILS